MKIKTEHQQILTACENRMVWLVKTGPPPAWKRWEVEDYQIKREHGPRYGSGAWFSSMPDSRRMRYRRAINDLESEGLLVPWCEYSKLSHLKLTAKGRKAAKELLQAHVTEEASCHLH